MGFTQARERARSGIDQYSRNAIDEYEIAGCCSSGSAWPAGTEYYEFERGRGSRYFSSIPCDRIDRRRERHQTDECSVETIGHDFETVASLVVVGECQLLGRPIRQGQRDNRPWRLFSPVRQRGAAVSCVDLVAVDGDHLGALLPAAPRGGTAWTDQHHYQL